MTLSEISIAFKKCNGSVSKSFKEFILELDLDKGSVKSGCEIEGSYNYILGDVEKLLDKTILNICASSLLLKKGYFNWGFVTSYYANFFMVQGLNRLMLDFTTFNTSTIECSYVNYVKGTLKLKEGSKSKGSHQRQFEKFYDNYKEFQNGKSIDRYWNIGVRPFKLKSEAFLRNIINYHIEKNLYYELDIDLSKFKKIIQDNKTYKFDSQKLKVSQPLNYSIPNLELALCRLRVCSYILNYIANDNNDYKNHLVSRNKVRLKNVKERYPELDDAIKDKLEKWLSFELIDTEQSVMV